MSNIVNLLPVILVAVGALASLAAEPFLKDENKHKVLPWVASFFVALAAGAYFLTTDAAAPRTRCFCRALRSPWCCGTPVDSRS